ncbi:hypothetical protein [Yinghuangia seranimata]|uniref:hypothetical protein n=1 Tax=Yinghuangia seranimata TaxID=408067 RepID=UPI00248B0B38|nr:hypothetical protein [Yinghuangia seranimata]MDI2132153.1 hypothetical protein [Yinghuangia seranimata]
MDGPLPTGADYSEALRDTALCFKHPALARGMVAMGPLRMPRVVSGNFGSVFRVTSTNPGDGGGPGNGREFAVKCFTRAVPDRLRRYRAIGRALDGLAAPDGDWRVAFEYVPEGVLVRGRWYPVILMEWLDGTALIPWLEAHLDEPDAITGLAAEFADVVDGLEASGIAHGDLQHGNLVVAREGGLRLIDYDGMYVPDLAGLGAAEHGHRNYQHPKRSAADFGPGLDRFSAHLIHLTLRALAKRPELWGMFHEEGGEHLLLTGNDLADPAGSERFATVACAVPELTDAFARLAVWAQRPLADVEPLGDGTGLPPRKPRAVASSAPAGPAAQGGGGLPPWLAEAVSMAGATGGTRAVPRTQAPAAPTAAPSVGEPVVPRLVGSNSGAGTGGSSASGANGRPPEFTPLMEAFFGPQKPNAAPPPNGGRPQVPSRPGAAPGSTPIPPPAVPRSFTKTALRTRVKVRAGMLVLLMAGALFGCSAFGVGPFAGVLPALAGVVGAVAVAGSVSQALNGVVSAAYRSSPEMLRRAAAERVAAQVAAAERLAAAKVGERRKAHRELQRRRTELTAWHITEARILKNRNTYERESVDRHLAEALDAVEQQRVLLEGSVARDELQALRSLQTRLLNEGLKKHPLPVALLGAGLVAFLGHEGVWTAADFTRVTSAVPTTPEERDRAVIVTSRPGRVVKVDGLPPAKARELQEWRDEIAEELRVRLPGALPYDVAQELHRKRAERRLDLARQAARARAAALEATAELDAGLTEAIGYLDGALATDGGALDAELWSAAAELADAEDAHGAAEKALANARNAVAAYDDLTTARFVWSVTTGL